MKAKKALILVALLVPFALAQAQLQQPTQITAPYGPPATADSFELFTIPLTPEAFNVDTVTFNFVLQNVTLFKIRTEMHTGNDVGGVDNIMVGSSYYSDFNSSQEGWSSGGDGTLAWMPEGGYEGGYIQISDWASGDWHWVIAPISWAGDWSGLAGQNITFYFKTDRPSYDAVVLLSNEMVYRMVLNTNVNSVALNDSTKIRLEVIPAPDEELHVFLTSSDNNCIKVPSTVIIPVGQQYVEFYATPAPDATTGCTSVIEATTTSYGTSRLTMWTVEDNSGIPDPGSAITIRVYPNPCRDCFMVKTGQPGKIERVRLYNLLGEMLYDTRDRFLTETDVHYINQPAGLYIFKIDINGNTHSGKLIVE
jgi:hypothetical protein